MTIISLNFSELLYNNNYTIQYYTILGYIIQYIQNVIYDKTRNYMLQYSEFNYDEMVN